MANITDDINNFNISEGVTPIAKTQLDEQEIDNLLVEEGINEDHYPNMNDIANETAIDDVSDIN